MLPVTFPLMENVLPMPSVWEPDRAQVVLPVWFFRTLVSVKLWDGPCAGVNVKVMSKTVGWNPPLPGDRWAGANTACMPLLVPCPWPLALFTTKAKLPAVPQLAVPEKEFLAPDGSAEAVAAPKAPTRTTGPTRPKAMRVKDRLMSSSCVLPPSER